MVSITADTVLSDWVSMIQFCFFYGRKHSASYFCHMSNVKAIRVGRAPIFKMKLLQRIAWNKLTIVLMAIVAKGTEGDNITIS